MKRREKITAAVMILGVIACTVGVAGGMYKEKTEEKAAKAEAAEDAELEKQREKIREIYDPDSQEEIRQELEDKKEEKSYSPDDMLVEYNPFGTNNLSLYVYFESEKATNVSCTIHVEDESIPDYTQHLTDEGSYVTEHEYQIIGLVPDHENEILFTFANPDGTTSQKTMTYEMGSLMGTEETVLSSEAGESEEQLENGLYVVLGNDSSGLDFMYYYDNNGVIRGEVPIIGYRSHRILFDEDDMYFSVSESLMAQMDDLGQIRQVYDLGQYELHHDYVFDDAGNILILATDTEQDSVEDIILRLYTEDGTVEEALDLEELFGSYKESCVENSDGDLDWMHINTIQWMGDGQILLSSRETSSIIKVNDIYGSPSIGYIISDPAVWENTSYSEYVLDKDGDFPSQGGQHSITYVEDDSLEDGQYYIYMFNNNIGVSETRPDFDWSVISGIQDSAMDGTASYFYKYLVDEEEGSYELTERFELPYSGYVSSVQEIGDNIVADSGMPGIFGEYDESGELIRSFAMEKESFIYRVYKYEF